MAQDVGIDFYHSPLTERPGLPHAAASEARARSDSVTAKPPSGHALETPRCSDTVCSAGRALDML